MDLRKTLSGKWEDGTRPKDLFARHIAKEPARWVGAIVDGLAAPERRVQNGCAELCSLLSAAEPALLAPHVGRFVDNLGADEAVLRWEAACTLGNLAAVDQEKRIPRALDRMIALLDEESIVLQGHAARALGKIARAYPERAAAILEALVAAAPRFPGSRVGYLVEAMEAFAAPKLAPRARAFAEKYAKSELRPVAAKAKRALKRLGRA